MFTEDFNYHVFSGPTNIFWLQVKALKGDHFLVYWKVAFCTFFMDYLLTVPASWTPEHFGEPNCFPWTSNIVVNSAPHQCLVLFKSIFNQKIKWFWQKQFSTFSEASETKGTAEKKKLCIAEIPCSSRTFMTMCFQVLEKISEYRGTIFKLIEKMFFVPFSWVIYLLFQHYEPLNFFVSQSVPCRLPKD